VRALVIDDSRATRLAVGRILESINIEVVEAEDGQQALEILDSQGPFELAMVDWNMPVMNGYDFVCAVRANAQYADVQLIMVTTENEMSQVVKALSAGVNEYIMKPFTDEMILEKLEMLGLK